MAFTRYPGATNRTTDFTSSGTWTCPSGVYSAEFFVVGAGGGGGGTGGNGATDRTACGGGGGGAVKRVTLATTPGTSYTITIGAKGTGGANNPGNNGGTTLVALSGTTLISCWGGQGGSGYVTGTRTFPTAALTIAGGGGNAETSTGTIVNAGGGGGAFPFIPNTYNLMARQTEYATPGEGSPGGTRSSVLTTARYSTPGAMGIDGYGAGGGGGQVQDAGPAVGNNIGGSIFAGNGGYRTSAGSSAGGSAVANTGCGGGGAAQHNTATTTIAGGDGADGLVRITYFA